MEKELIRLIDELKRFGQLCRNENTENEIIGKQVKTIIDAAAELYRNEEIRLYIPCFDNGSPGVYREGDRNYIPVCSSIEEVYETGNTKGTPTNLKEICLYLYDNNYYYQLLSDPEAALKASVPFSRLSEYADKNIRFEGFILDASSDHLFAFESWILQAVMFKGMGVDSFSVYDSESGEKKYEV